MTDFRQTKILATLGPGSNSPEMIRKLIDAGVNIFRLNFSHGSHADHAKACEIIRAAATDSHKNIGVLADLQGPKLRIGIFEGGKVALQAGQSFIFDLDDKPGDSSRVCLPHPEILNVLEQGSLIYLDDGKVRAKVTAKNKNGVETEIIAGSHLSDRKGFNIPGAALPIPALTDKDKADLQAALEIGADWIAQSFVQTKEDVQEAKDLINGRAALMIKIEKPAALEHFDEMLELADGVMLARGDLGIELPAHKVPVIQKDIIDRTRRTGKPVVVATQMLESMISNPQPTRAEVSDVATAVFDGADAVMLWAETAVGDYALEAVRVMHDTALEVETARKYRETMERRRNRWGDLPSDAITAAAYNVANQIEAKVLVCYTTSGSTALRMARQRPGMPILCLTPSIGAARRMSVSFGVIAEHAPETATEDFTGPARFASNLLKTLGLAEAGQRFVMTAGMPFNVPGSTNILRIAKVK